MEKEKGHFWRFCLLSRTQNGLEAEASCVLLRKVVNRAVRDLCTSATILAGCAARQSGDPWVMKPLLFLLIGAYKC